MFRHEHLDDLLHIYFEDLIDVVRELGLSEKQYHPEFNEFRNEFFKVLQFRMQYRSTLEFRILRNSGTIIFTLIYLFSESKVLSSLLCKRW